MANTEQFKDDLDNNADRLVVGSRGDFMEAAGRPFMPVWELTSSIASLQRTSRFRKFWLRLPAFQARSDFRAPCE
jgi:hypothetical protein